MRLIRARNEIGDLAINPNYLIAVAPTDDNKKTAIVLHPGKSMILEIAFQDFLELLERDGYNA